ncbi:DUF397 domain-containing protein [Saccharopolyspora sp. K220]|uniref:DUF397 domain-containing protein n=1 Tax=Saccharopolyspora soli TaxID=2926618 RepID=UPI001F583E5B|nr:DUF397 domain-containing protein [Saccharopolyspora soli]MCI2416184.1 DUF397 domain-containing protein [Saccharopolyspora soli]
MEFTGWRKSSRSIQNDNCVEVGFAPGHVGIRDTKLGADSPILSIDEKAFATFLTGVRDRWSDI